MDILLEKLSISDAEKLFAFELENRSFFEEMVPTRGNDYYNFDVFKGIHEALLDEQAKGVSDFYLIKNEKGSVLGRMNLVDIDEYQGIGHLGYRVGKEYTGKGIGNHALKLFLEKIVEEDRVKQIKAKTTTNNIASQKVLEKNGFEHIYICDEVFEMNGHTMKFVYYTWSI